MDQFTINKEDLTGLSGKVAVITGNFFPVNLPCL